MQWTSPTSCSLTVILAEANDPASPARLDQRRAEWFALMLRNQIETDRGTLAFVEREPQFATPELVGFRTDRIARCQAAIRTLEG